MVGQIGSARGGARTVWGLSYQSFDVVCGGVALLAAIVGLACSLDAKSGDLSTTTSSGAANPGDIVGTLEVAVPRQYDFVLHGTLPVPPRTFTSAEGEESPFLVVDADGTLVPAQTEVVSRYAAAGDGADVVEIIARVHVPPRTNKGDRLRYDVVYRPHGDGPFRPHPEVEALLSGPGNLALRSRDVFGNAYAADLLGDWRARRTSLRILKDGSVERQFATHESLRPTAAHGGPDATLPHLMGAHAYVTEWAGEPFFALDLRVHNAHSGLSQQDPIDDALGKMYFESLELTLPAGWYVFNAFPDPYFGAPRTEGASGVWPIVNPIQGGAMHVMAPMSQFHRRLMICKAGSEKRAVSAMKEETLGFCRAGHNRMGVDFWSWWNPRTARYFPQRHRLPSLDHVGLEQLRHADAAELGTRALQVQTGSVGPWPAQEMGLGWAHPWGINIGWMVGGLEINLYEGVTTACAASQDGYRLSQLMHRMLSDRQPNVLFNADGRPTRIEDWLVETSIGTFLPVMWYGGPLPWTDDVFGISTSPSFQRDAVVGLGRQPPWEGVYLDYEMIDQAHLIRYTRMAKALAWLGNDAIAKDDLRAQAEGVRLGYSMYRHDSYPQGFMSTSMFAARLYVDAHPGWGFPYTRAEAWGLDTVCASYSLGEPEWRRIVRPWFDLVVDLVEDGQMDCTGIIEANPQWNIFNAQYRCRQSIECAITENALVGMRESAFRGDDEERVRQVNGVLAKSLYSMISPLVWSDQAHGPWAMIAVGSMDMNQPPFCSYWPPDGNYGFRDAFQIWSSFAYGYEITGDPIFLTKAAEALGGDLRTRIQEGGAENIQSKAALIALVQSLP